MPRINFSLWMLLLILLQSMASSHAAPALPHESPSDDRDSHYAFEKAQGDLVDEAKSLIMQAHQVRDEIHRKQLYRKLCELNVKYYMPLARKYPTSESGIRFLCRCVSLSPEAVELLKQHPADKVGDKFINEASNNIFFEYDYPLVMNSGFAEVIKAKATLGLAFSFRRKTLHTGQPAGSFDASDRVSDDGMQVCKTLIKNYGDTLIYFTQIEIAGGVPRYFHQTMSIKELAEDLNYEFQYLRIGRPMPVLSAVDLEGKPLNLSDYKGKLVLLDFFSRDLSDYKQFQAEREQLAKKLAGKPVAFLGVHVKTTEGMVDVTRSIKPWRLLKDQSDPTLPAISRQWSIHTLPTTYVIDHQGILLTKHFYRIPAQQMENAIESWLKEMK